MLVNCFFALVGALQGVQLSPLGFAACQSKNCTNRVVGYCSVGALQGGAVVPTAPTELLGCYLVGALQGGAAVSAAPTKLLATAWLVHCKGVQLSQLHQQSCGAFNRLVHLRQVHPLRLLHEHLLHLATCCAHDVDAALQALHAYAAEGVDGYILVVVGCSERVDCCRVGIFLAEHYVYV